MGNRNRNRSRQTVTNTNTSHQGASMSQEQSNHQKIQEQRDAEKAEHDRKQKELETAFNAKKETPSSSAPASPSDKKGDAAVAQVKDGGKETKEGVVKVVTGIPSMVWNKALKPAYEFLKGIVTRAWNGLVNMYHAEIGAFKELGAKKYFLGRGGKLGLKLFKILGAAAVVSFINNLLFNYTGISLFDPMTLGIIAIIALVCVVGSSYYAQKDVGAEFKAGVTGQHITEAFMAA